MESAENKGEKQIKLLPYHYYMDGKFLVFTEQYHIDRGYCCGTSKGCRHCPYEPKHIKGTTTLTKK
jgi:hypothetical protein